MAGGDAVVMDGLVYHTGHKWQAFLTCSQLSITKVGSDLEKEQTTYIPISEVVAVSADPAQAGAFHLDVVVSFNVFAQDEMQEFAFKRLTFVAAASEVEVALQDCKDWVAAFECMLARKPFQRGQKMLHVPRRYKVIVNPAAGDRRGPEVIHHLQPLMARANIILEVTTTSLPGHAMEIARVFSPLLAAAKPPVPAIQYDAIVIVGGDGTVLETINGLLGRDDWAFATMPPLMIIPTGLKNRIARGFGILDVSSGARSLLGGQPRKVDVMSVSYGSSRLFLLDSVSWGPINTVETGGFLGGRYAALLEAIAGTPGETATITYHKAGAKAAAHGSASQLRLTSFDLGLQRARAGIDMSDDMRALSVDFGEQGPVARTVDSSDESWVTVTGSFFGVAVANLPAEINNLKPCPRALVGDGALDLCLISAESGVSGLLWEMAGAEGLSSEPREGVTQVLVDVVKIQPRVTAVKVPRIKAANQDRVAVPEPATLVTIEVLPSVLNMYA